MKQKLTLRFDAGTIESAKFLARSRKTSLSKMVKDLLQKEINHNVNIDLLPIAPPVARAKASKPSSISDKEIKNLRNHLLAKKHHGA